MKYPSTILIDAPAWVGDLVMAHSLFQVLKQQYPHAKIHVLAPEWARFLLDHMPEVDHMLVSPFEHGVLQIQKRYKLAQNLPAYDWAILLRNSFKSALIPWFAQIPRRTGWVGEHRYGLVNDWRHLDKKRYVLMVERFVALAYAAGEPLPSVIPRPHLKVSALAVQETLKRLHVTPAPGQTLALCPGAEYGSSKRWPAAHFATVAQNKLQQGWSVLLLGAAKDQAITRQINALCGERCTDLAGRTHLGQAIDILSIADQVVSNDSGLMHIASALNRPLVAVYGSTSPAFAPPLTDTAKAIFLDLPCSPCHLRTCAWGHTNCLMKLTPERVLNAIES